MSMPRGFLCGRWLRKLALCKPPRLHRACELAPLAAGLFLCAWVFAILAGGQVRILSIGSSFPEPEKPCTPMEAGLLSWQALFMSAMPQLMQRAEIFLG